MSGVKLTNKKRILISAVFLLVWCALLFYLSSQNGPQTAQQSGSIAKFISKLIFGENSDLYYNNIHIFLRKASHIVLYYVVFFPVMGIFSSFGFKKTALKYGFAILAVSALSFFDEWHKLFISGRHFDVIDALLNILGALLAMITVSVFKTIKNKSKQSI